jgi:hypothetical protein
MATSKNQPESQAAEPQWQTVSDETQEDEYKFTFDVIGQSFTGEYIGTRQVPAKDEFGFDTGRTFTQFRFRDENGQTCFINPLASLRDAMARVRAGNKVRLTYVADKDTGQASMMQLIKVEVDASYKRGSRSRSPVTVTSGQADSEPPF